mmetsp:Transcript_27249/g.50477  ORF Transcript_27249/g.50477 Transcript_27249/m.50477 type:complete len:440 (-) Transcript_27249:542-1861(-)
MDVALDGRIARQGRVRRLGQDFDAVTPARAVHFGLDGDSARAGIRVTGLEKAREVEFGLVGQDGPRSLGGNILGFSRKRALGRELDVAVDFDLRLAVDHYEIGLSVILPRHVRSRSRSRGRLGRDVGTPSVPAFVVAVPRTASEVIELLRTVVAQRVSVGALDESGTVRIPQSEPAHSLVAFESAALFLNALHEPVVFAVLLGGAFVVLRTLVPVVGGVRERRRRLRSGLIGRLGRRGGRERRQRVVGTPSVKALVVVVPVANSDARHLGRQIPVRVALGRDPRVALAVVLDESALVGAVSIRIPVAARGKGLTAESVPSAVVTDALVLVAVRPSALDGRAALAVGDGGQASEETERVDAVGIGRAGSFAGTLAVLFAVHFLVVRRVRLSGRHHHWRRRRRRQGNDDRCQGRRRCDGRVEPALRSHGRLLNYRIAASVQ